MFRFIRDLIQAHQDIQARHAEARARISAAREQIESGARPGKHRFKL